MKKVKIHYVAMLRDKAGVGEEAVETDASSIEELYAQLASRHAFPWQARSMRPAVNDEVAPWDHAINDGDEVVFLPPPSGG